jgi:hypothetical protein
MKNKRKIFLCGITHAGNEKNLKDLLNPVIEHFDGIVWTFHYPKDEGADYLESIKGDGEIIYANFSQRHGYSMTHYLWQGPMKNGDVFIQLDTMERISPKFCYERLPGLISLMDEAELGMIANYGKGMLFKYSEELEFRGSPHWYAINVNGKAINMELPKDEFWNVRSEQRDSYQWVTHYLKYWLYPAGSNHALLGLEKQGDPQKLFPQREAARLNFRNEVVNRGYDLTVDGIKQMFKDGLDNTLKQYINSEKTLNDAYRYFILNDKTVVDNHDPKSMKKVL